MNQEELLELQQRYRKGLICEKNMSEEQIQALCSLYDKQIRETKASNINRKKAIEAEKHNLYNATLVQVNEKLEGYPIWNTKDKRLEKFYLKPNLANTGLDLYNETSYLGTYLSYNDYLYDLSFYYSIIDFDSMLYMFEKLEYDISKPYKFRGQCTELYQPSQRINNYIHYSNSLQEMFAAFEQHEKRAISKPDKFQFAVNGIEIHIFNQDTKKYNLWIGGNELRSVSDVISLARKENKLIPSEVVDELKELEKIDVFISHKSEDFVKSKKVYDYLTTLGVHTFLSEMSLPAISNSDYTFEIDNALDKAKNLIVIATSKENVMSGWVKHEWSSFANEIRSGRKDGNIITLLDENMEIKDLPLSLRQHEALKLNDLDTMKKFLKI